MYKIRLISCYFGELKSEFYLWLNSCGYNKTIDFLFVTDQEIIADICPPNVKILHTTLKCIIEFLILMLNWARRINYAITKLRTD